MSKPANSTPHDSPARSEPKPAGSSGAGPGASLSEPWSVVPILFIVALTLRLLHYAQIKHLLVFGGRLFMFDGHYYPLKPRPLAVDQKRFDRSIV